MKSLKTSAVLLFFSATFFCTVSLYAFTNGLTYPIVHTGQTNFYSDTAQIYGVKTGNPFFGQNGNYLFNLPTYTDNSDGTITDNITGLMWEKDMGEKISFVDAQIKAEKSTLGGFDDWRIPSIKELYSLILFSGESGGESAKILFLDTRYFIQPLGDVSRGEREIDAQTWSSTVYSGKTMLREETQFGVNFIDGRIKGYPKYDPRTKTPNKMYFRFVRGNTKYGKNEFIDNGDGTISDLSTGLMWQKKDSGKGMSWQEALFYAEGLDIAGYMDWRLPSAKELQSIVDYSRSPQFSNSAAIDPVFNISSLTDPNGRMNYPYFWTSTTHLDGRIPAQNAVYIAFGEALGMMRGQIMDVHGAGAQRSDPKYGEKSDFPQYFGPQGDMRVVYNYVRSVRNIE